MEFWNFNNLKKLSVGMKLFLFKTLAAKSHLLILLKIMSELSRFALLVNFGTFDLTRKKQPCPEHQMTLF